MKKNRYLLCLLVCGLLLYIAVPRLSVLSEGSEGTFAQVWLAFAFIVTAGNLTALLYSPKSTTNRRKHIQGTKTGKRARSYN